MKSKKLYEEELLRKKGVEMKAVRDLQRSVYVYHDNIGMATPQCFTQQESNYVMLH